jgi:hypothetical protein
MRRLVALIVLALVAVAVVAVAASGPATPPEDTDRGQDGPPRDRASRTDPALEDRFPSASTTGVPAGTTLTTPRLDDDNNYTVSSTGAVVTGVNVPGCILVMAAGVTIQNSKARCITTSYSATAQNPANPRLTIQDNDIDCTQSAGTNPLNSGVWAENFNAYRNDIRDCENGFYAGSNFTIEDNYIHDLFNSARPVPPPDGPHTDGVQVYDPGGDNAVIRHNTIYGFSDRARGNWPCGADCNGTSAIIYNNVPPPGGNPPVENVVIDNNLLAGGSVALYCPRQRVSRFALTSNHFSTIYSPNVGEGQPGRKLSALSSNCEDETQSDNVVHETGKPVTLR